MPHRKKSMSGIYHVYSRGVKKLPIGHHEYDYYRAMLSIIIMQFGTRLPSSIAISKETLDFYNKSFNIVELEEKLTQSYPRIVEVFSYCVMKNHIHIVFKELIENGSMLYMRRVINSITTYYNKKYKDNGRLFSTEYKSVPIESEKQFFNVINYVHKNPYKYEEWIGNEVNYPYSSFQDYMIHNRWNSLITITDEYPGL